MVPATFKLSPLQVVVLLHHVIHYPEASNDTDRTVKELISEIDRSRGWLNRSLFESSLYCCNLMNEEGKFWHPFGINFDKFIYEVVPNDLYFDRYYNMVVSRELYEEKEKVRSPSKER